LSIKSKDSVEKVESVNRLPDPDLVLSKEDFPINVDGEVGRMDINTTMRVSFRHKRWIRCVSLFLVVALGSCAGMTASTCSQTIKFAGLVIWSLVLGAAWQWAPCDVFGYLCVLVQWGVVLWYGPTGWSERSMRDFGRSNMSDQDMHRAQLSTYWVSLSLAYVVAALSYLFTLRFQAIVGKAYVGTNVFYMFIACLLVFSSSTKIEGGGASLIVNKTSNPMQSTADQYAQIPETSYGVCQMSWGSQYSPRTAIDVSQLAGLAYETDCSSMTEHLRHIFPSDGYHFNPTKDCSDYNSFPRWVVFDFPANDSLALGTRVFAFKGTSTVTDAHMDATLWSTVKVLQLFANVVPVLSLLPIDQVQWMMEAYHMQFMRRMERSFWHRVVELARNKTIGADDGHKFRHVFTGHSLGGGLAQVVAARLGQEALVFSPPGMGYSAQRFGIHRGKDYFPHFRDNGLDHPLLSVLGWFQGAPAMPEVYPESINGSHSLHIGVEVAEKRIVIVEPQADIVPQVDLQVGLKQTIECRIKGGKFGGAANCHSMQKTACELWRSCADREGEKHGRIMNCIGSQHWQVQARSEAEAWYTPDEVV